ncbi:MAG: hypothetical protein ACRDBG_04515 [Waterburya sp.]
MQIVWKNDDYRIETETNRNFTLINSCFGTKIRGSKSLEALLDWIDRDWKYQPITDKGSRKIAREIAEISSGELKVKKTENDRGTTIWQAVGKATIAFQSLVLVDLKTSVEKYYRLKNQENESEVIFSDDRYRIERRFSLSTASYEYVLINQKYNVPIQSSRFNSKLRRVLLEAIDPSLLSSSRNWMASAIEKFSGGKVSAFLSNDSWMAIDLETRSIVAVAEKLSSLTIAVKRIFVSDNENTSQVREVA